jgi:hypothetical protein
MIYDHHNFWIIKLRQFFDLNNETCSAYTYLQLGEEGLAPKALQCIVLTPIILNPLSTIAFKTTSLYIIASGFIMANVLCSPGSSHDIVDSVENAGKLSPPKNGTKRL